MHPSKIVKLIKAIDLLGRPQGTTIDALKAELGVDRRSVYRLLDTMQQLGFPIYDEKGEGRRKCWKFEQSYLQKLPNLQLPDLKLTVSEVIGLYLAKSDMTALHGTEIGVAVDSAFNKIGSLLPNNLFAKLDKIKALFVSTCKDGKEYAGKEKVIADFIKATLEQKTCVITYNSFSTGRCSQFLIDPLHIFERYGGLYGFVRTTDYGDIRMLALERIATLKISTKRFSPPQDFDPVDRLDEAFDLILDDPVEAVIWFSAEQAPYVMERKRFNGKWSENPDGSILLRLKTSGRWDIVRWVLSCGAGARVVEPKDLQDALVAEITAMQGIYGNCQDS